MIFVRFILWIWQLPQNLVGLFVVIILGGKKCVLESEDKSRKWTYYVIDKKIVRFSVAFGQFIIVPPKNEGRETTMRHEWGHTKQSSMFGPLYLLIIGLPSFIRNRISVWCNKPSSWYYGYVPHKGCAYPEKWADKLGGVKRT